MILKYRFSFKVSQDTSERKAPLDMAVANLRLVQFFETAKVAYRAMGPDTVPAFRLWESDGLVPAADARQFCQRLKVATDIEVELHLTMDTGTSESYQRFLNAEEVVHTWSSFVDAHVDGDETYPTPEDYDVCVSLVEVSMDDCFLAARC